MGKPRWYLQLVTDSTAEPVATTDIKRQVNLPSTNTGDDAWIADTIKSARRLVEKGLPGGRALINQTWDLVLDQFPDSDMAIELPLPPLQSITSITYFDAANSSTTLASSDYRTLTPTNQPGWIRPAIDAQWPATAEREDAVKVRFVAGYGSAASSVPMNLRHAIKMLAAHWYENREAVGSVGQEIDLAFQSLIGAEQWGYYG